MATLYRKSGLRSLFFWIIEIVLVVILAFAFSRGFCRAVIVRDDAMSPTLAESQKALINSAGYLFGAPKQGDVVAFRIGESETVHIRRVIGMPGDTIQITGGQILINGETYMDKLGLPPIDDPGLAAEPIALEENEYFLLGDNRNASEDSRHSSVGLVRRGDILGKIWIRISPFSSFGRVH